jgi:hypothetical protein
MRKIREIEGIKNTLTMIIIAAKGPKREREKESKQWLFSIFLSLHSDSNFK